MTVKFNKYYIFWVCGCSLSYPACKYAPYCHLWHARLYNIFFRIISKNGTILGEKKLLNTKCVFRFSLQTLSEIFFNLRIFERVMVKNVNRSSCNVPAIFAHFNETLIFSTNFRKIPKYQISLKSVQCEPSCSVRTDRRTDMTKLIIAFHNFANAPEKMWYILINFASGLLTLLWLGYLTALFQLRINEMYSKIHRVF